MLYTIQEAKDEIKSGIKSYLMKDENGVYRYKETARMPFYLEGPPGIGKTEIVSQVAKELGIGFVSFSITHHTRNTLLGLPVIVEEENCRYTEYTMSEIIAKLVQAQREGFTEGILLLDEFNCASETIFPMMLAMLQTRNIGQYKIPEGWNLVLCGNPPEYNKSARTFDAVILDRVRRMKLQMETKEFFKYAEQQNMHPLILKYLRLNKFNTYQCQSEGTRESVVTCRGWENLSHALYAYEEMGTAISVKLVEQFLKSEEIAGSFATFYDLNKDGRMEDILNEMFSKELQDNAVQRLSQKSVDYIWNLTEQVVKVLEQAVGKKEKPGVTSDKISAVFRVFQLLSNGEMHKEHFYQMITESGVLCGVMLKVRNDAYLSMCRKSFALEEKKLA